MTTTPTTAETVDAFFAHFGAGDIPSLVGLFADEVDFEVAGAALVPWTGPRTGKHELDEFFNTFGKVLGAPESFDIATKVIAGDNAVAIGSCAFPVLATGKTFTNKFALHFTVVGGKITGYHMYEDSYAIYEAFLD